MAHITMLINQKTQMTKNLKLLFQEMEVVKMEHMMFI